MNGQQRQKNAGLYRPSFEHDNCGIGAIVNIKGQKSHDTVANALKIVETLEHRAGKDAAGETGDGYGSFEDASPRGDDRRSTYSQESYQNGSTPNIHYFDLNKWYWKLALVVLLFLVISVVFSIMGSVFYLLIRFSGPILMCLIIYWLVKNFRGR